MINIDILRGTWLQVGSEISARCDAIDAAPEPDVEALTRQMHRLMDECEHLRMLLREAEMQERMRAERDARVGLLSALG